MINSYMDATNNIATDLFYKVRSRFTGLKLGEETGQITINPENARFFDFDYTENDKNIGHVSISLAEPNSMKVYFSSGITEGMDQDQKGNWYAFLKELRMFAKRRLLAFDTRDIAKDNLDKRDYAFLSQHSTPQSDNDTITKPVGEAVMNESNLYGTKTQSFQKLMDTRLIIKHSKKLADDFEQKPGDRSRNISALFVENQDGERFKYPFIHLAGARAMQRHVANGGLPYDAIGESLIKMSEEIAQLKSFTNYCVRNDLMNSDTNSIVERSKAQLDGLRERIAKLSKQAHYENYVAEFQAPEAMEVPEDVMKEYTEKFTVKNFKEDIANAFPIIYKLMKEEEKVGYDDIVGMSEADDNKEETEEKVSEDPMASFENWVNQLGEESPITMADDEEKSDMIKKLNGMLKTEFQAGVEGINAIQSLEGIIEDPKLEQDIKKADPEQDVRPMIKAWIEENEPDVLGELDFGDMIDEPAAAADEVEPQQEDMSMGMNKYGLAAVNKGGKFFSIKDNEITGEFDSIEELKKHQEELLNKEEESVEVAEGGNAWDLAVTTGMEIIQDCNDAEECIKRLEDEITGSNEPDESYADMIYKDYIEKIKTDGFDKVRHEIDSQEFHGDMAGDVMDMQGQTNEDTNDDLENFMTKIANSDDGYELMDQGLDGQHGPEIQKKLQSMYDNVAVDNGYHPDDDFEKIHDRMIDNITDDYGTNETVVGGNAKPADPNSMYARLMTDINEIQVGAMEGNDMADFIADELGDYLRNGDAPEGSVYEKTIGIIMDALNDGPDAQAEAAEQAGDFLHSELNKEDDMEEARDDGGAGVVEKLLQGITKDFVKGDDSAAQKMVDMLKKYKAPMDKVADMLEQQAEKLTKKTFGIFDNPLKKTPASDAADRMVTLADYIRSKAGQQEGNEFAQKVRQMKAAGAKKGTKFKTSDGEEHTLEGLAEFIKSFYDKNTGTFPKGPEGVATMVGKKFGEQAEQVARKMVERMAPAQEQGAEDLEELGRIKELIQY